MRSLEQSEITRVAGGGSDEEDAKDRALKVCNLNDLPDETKVTITVQETGSMGFNSTSWTNTSGTSIQTTCGELRDAASTKTGGGSKS